MTTITTTIEVDGTTYEAELGRIQRADICFEDHGFWTDRLVWESFTGASGQGFGGYMLGNSKKVLPVMGEWLIALMTTVGVKEWSDMTGQPVYALRHDSTGLIAGIVGANTNDALIFDEWWDDHWKDTK